ncbi:hypothetical protein CEP52_003735 [Fusarium oligoseptatum]|uniref:Uncharacterized protein n=1 Tax=Fusarium oligoseptatum TaxID=2604345 RepID=A0A428U749_9HYPO|nr:hypothetical protein CEP52_003735 [Fusarium oligoseptatum]
MSDLTHFDLLPLQMDPQSKSISSHNPSRALAAELETLNALHRSLLNLETPSGAPPPPIPVNPKRTANVTKLRDSGNAEYRKGKPMWEPAALVREEVSSLLANRAQAHMALQNWAEGAVDAHASVEARWVGNAKAWWRRGRCLSEMGRLEEARDWVKRGLEVEGEEAELVQLLKDVEGKIEKEQA